MPVDRLHEPVEEVPFRKMPTLAVSEVFAPDGKLRMRYPHVFAARRQATQSVASGRNTFHAYAVLRHSAVVDSYIALLKVAGRHKSRFRDDRV